jgi:F0F1-type ATP synthase assembly protein I
MKNYSWPTVVRLVAVLSSWIIFPVLIGLFLGQWLDRKYGTAPWLFLTLTGVAFFVSMIGLLISATRELKKIDEAKDRPEKNEKKTNDKNNDKNNDLK